MTRPRRSDRGATNPHTARSWLGRLALLVIRFASLGVPADQREGWRREWSAELWHRERSVARRPAWTRASPLLGPLPGAFLHALTLRFAGFRFDSAVQDLLFALRSYRRAPAYTIVSLVTLGLGVGTTVAVLSVLHGALIRPYAYGDPDRIVVLGTERVERPGDLLPLAYAEIADLMDLGVFESVTAYEWDPFNVRLDDRTEWVGAGVVSPSLFRTFGLAPLLGRVFLPDDAVAEASPVVIIGASFWRRVFGAGDVIGQTLWMDGIPHEVVGVAPEAMDVPRGANLWVPLRPNGAATTRDSRWLQAYARLTPGTTWDQATAALNALAPRLAEAFPGSYDARSFAGIEIREYRAGEVRTGLLALAGALGLLLMIVGANLASLTLARAANRAGEFGVRRALGAGRGRLGRQLLVEGAVLGSVAGVLGVVAGFSSLVALGQLIPERPTWFSPSLGPYLALIGVSTAVLVACSLALIPLASRSSGWGSGQVVTPTEGEAPTSRSRDALVFAEVAFTTILLLGAGMLILSLTRLSAVDPGFEAEGRLTGTVQLPLVRYADDESVLAFVESLERGLMSTRDVVSAGMVTRLPFRSGTRSVMWQEESQSADASRENPRAELNSVTPGYLGAMGIERLRGRMLGRQDGADSPPVVVVSETFASGHFGARNPIGNRISFANRPRLFEIVGVVEDVKHEQLGQAPRFQIYAPFAQRPTQRLSLVVEGTGSPAELAPAIRGVLRQLDPDLAIAELSVMEDMVLTSVWRLRLLTRLVWACAAFAVLLAAVGVAGVVAHSVARRTREIGIRLALGARAPDVVTLVCGRMAVVLAGGLTVGVVAGASFGRWAEESLFGVDPHDPWIYLAIIAGFACFGGVAALLPVRRAMRLDPVRALRAD